MSGIAGIVRFDGAPAEVSQIEALTAAMRQRGPDAQTVRLQGPVALGHCMLRTTPESLEETQPLASHDGNLVLVWDGRIDNRKSLERDLVNAGARLRERSDAELALHSYAIWGAKSPERLLGDFAYAVWDRRQGKLFCARDPMGARPLYYTRNDSFFAFTSEEEVLTLLPGVSGRPNEARIAYALVPAFEDFDHARSWLEDVWTLPPGKTLAVSPRGALEIRGYWQLQPGEESRYASDAECSEAFLEVFGEAVRCRMRALGDISAMMSGGLDSAGIAAMVKRLLPQMPDKTFHTYSAVSDQPDTCIETRCIQSLTRELGERAHFVSVPSFKGMASLPDLIETAWSTPHPVDNSILLPAMMARCASRDGLRVMLHGASGDLTMHTPLHYASYFLRSRQWGRAWHECKDASRNNNYLRGTTPPMLFTKAFWHAYMPGSAKRTLQVLRSRIGGSSPAGSVVNDAFSCRLGLVPRLREQRANRCAERWDSLRHEHAAAMHPYGIVRGLEGYDRVAGRHGIEFRDPWADRRVVEFFVRLPLEYRVRNGWTKHLVRSAFPELEHGVRYRLGKEHLGWQFSARAMDASEDLIARTLRDESSPVHAYLNKGALQAQLDAWKRDSCPVDGEPIYDKITLALWLIRTGNTATTRAKKIS